MLKNLRDALQVAFYISVCFMMYKYVQITPAATVEMSNMSKRDTIDVQRIIYDTVTVYDTVTIKSIVEETKPVKMKKFPAHCVDYVNTYLPYAEQVEKEFGIDKIFILAQPAIESGWGTDIKATEAFNLFGIHRIKGYDSYGKYCKFKTLEDGYKKYAELVKKYCKDAKTVDELAYAIAHSKYAGHVGDKEWCMSYTAKVIDVAIRIRSYLELEGQVYYPIID